MAQSRKRKPEGIPPVQEWSEDESESAFAIDGRNDARPPAEVAGISGERLKSFIERIERLKAEIADLQSDIKEVKAEAKGSGFDIKVINYLVKLRGEDADDRDEFESLVDVYARAIGMRP